MKSIYYATFESHLFYSCLVWAQNTNSIKRLYILQKKSYIPKPYANIPKSPDRIALENCIFIKKYLNQTLPTPFKNWFTLPTDSHTDNTKWSNLGCLKMPPHKTKIYGRQSVKISAIYIWNYLQRIHKNIFYQLSLTKRKKLIKQYYFSNYGYFSSSFLPCIYIFVFINCSFFIIKHSKSAFYVQKVKFLRGRSLHLGPAI